MLSSCKTTKDASVTGPAIIEAEFDERLLDTLMVVASKESDASPEFTRPDYKGSATRTHDLLHTKL